MGPTWLSGPLPNKAYLGVARRRSADVCYCVMLRLGMWAYIRKPAEQHRLFKELANTLQSFVIASFVFRVTCVDRFVYHST